MVLLKYSVYSGSPCSLTHSQYRQPENGDPTTGTTGVRYYYHDGRRRLGIAVGVIIETENLRGEEARGHSVCQRTYTSAIIDNKLRGKMKASCVYSHSPLFQSHLTSHLHEVTEKLTPVRRLGKESVLVQSHLMA